MQLNEKLILMRKESNITQKQLAKLLGIGQSTISQWEKGQALPAYDAIVKLCDYYDISADFLCGLVNEKGCYEKAYKNLNDEQHLFINLFNKLSGNQKALVFQLMKEVLRLH